MKIYDYTHVLEHSYFIQDGGRVVLIDLDLKTISVSKTLRLFFILSKYECCRLKEGSRQYHKVLKEYNQLLQRLVYTGERQGENGWSHSYLKQII